jgi:hypothetical protein
VLLVRDHLRSGHRQQFPAASGRKRSRRRTEWRVARVALRCVIRALTAGADTCSLAKGLGAVFSSIDTVNSPQRP